MANQPDLARHEQEAVALEIDAMLEGRTQTEVGKLLGLAQATVGKAHLHRALGRDVSDRVCAYLGTSLEELVERHGLHPELPAWVHPLEIAIAYHGESIGQEVVRRVRAHARGRSLTARQWGDELRAEQGRLIEFTPTAGVPLLPAVPESSRRRTRR